MPEQVKKSFVLSIYLALLISTLLVFWQVRNFDFTNYDDDLYVYENSHVLNGLTTDAISWAFTTSQASNWHPLTWFSLMLDCQLLGPNPGRIHLINLLLHIANTLLLFAVLKKMTGSLWPSAFVAAAFALHPMHVESVAWITERKDVLSTLFWILTIAAYYRYIKRPGIARYLLTLLVFALGLMIKPMLVTLPFVFLLLDYWPLNRIGRFNWKIIYSLVWEKIPFFALAAVSSIITFLVQRTSGAMVGINTLSFNKRVANVFLSYVQYISKMFWPSNLAVSYPFNAGSIPFGQAAICALLLLVISFFVVRLGRSQKYLPMGWFWFVITFIPVIGIVQVGGQAYADRYTYIPYIGLFIMLAWGLPQFLSKLPQRKIILGVSMVIVLTTLGICAHRQVSYWKNSLTLFSHALAVTQNNCLAYNNIGLAYNDIGRTAEAIDAYKQAIKIKPNYESAYNNLGVVYGNLGRGIDSIDAYKQAIKFKPDYAMAYYNLGLACGNLHRWSEAMDALKQAVKIKPDLAEGYYNLGYVYLVTGDKKSALAEYNILKSLNPQSADDLFKQINK